jgi:hypothetical protein
LAARLSEMHSPAGRLREKADLIRRERAAKYASAVGQRPDRVETIGQHSYRIDRERMRPPRLAKHAAQALICCVSNRSPALRQIIGEKKLPPARKLRRIRSCRHDRVVARRQCGAVAFTAGPEAEPSVLLDQVMG